MVRLLKEYVYVLVIALYPVLLVYFRNVHEAGAEQLKLPILFFLAVALLAWLFFSAWAGRFAVGALIAQLTLLIAALWRPLETAVRAQWVMIRYWHLFPVALAVGVIAALLLGRRARLGKTRFLAYRKWLAGLFAILIVYNAAGAVPVLWRRVTQFRRAPAAPASVVPVAARVDRPDVYLIILDEFAPFLQIQKHFNWRPVELAQYLRQRQFSVSGSSYNPSFLTVEVLAGLVGMEWPAEITQYQVAADGRIKKYVNTPDLDQHTYFAESTLMRFFQAHGYTVYAANMLGDLFNVSSPFVADYTFQLPPNAGGVSLENTVFASVLKNSVLEPLLTIWPHDKHFYNRMVEGILGWLADPNIRRAPSFTFAHIACPHAPYLFEPDGAWRKEEGSVKVDDFYLAQYQFIAKRIIAVLEQIIAANPDCIVLVQSDHSYRHELTMPVDDMASIFNAVYYRGRAFNIESLSGLDTLRRVLNETFGTDFPIHEGRRPLAGLVQ
ncbi:MAG TPA: hypothetical protein PKY11_00500 [Kiritimatiellia bacterium]|nr:hypothetical protein [Kiritimatiellia bacterium]